MSRIDYEKESFENVYKAITSSYMKDCEEKNFHNEFIRGAYVALTMCLLNLNHEKYREMVDEINSMIMN